MTGVGPDDRAAWARHLGVDPGAVDPAGLRVELAHGSLPAAFAEAAARSPDRTALSIDGRGATHGELDDAAARVAAALGSDGITSGDRVLLCARSSLDLVRAYLGLLRAGAVVVLANPAAPPRDLAAQAAAAGAVLALGAAVPGLPARSLDELAAAAAGHPPAPVPDLDPTATALLAFTSGTTGRPKGVPLSHANLLASVRAVLRAWRWAGSDVLVHALPLFHQHGLGGVHATLVAGSRAALLSRFDPPALLDLATRERATVVFGVPTMYERLLGAGPAALRRLRLAVCGSAPLPSRLAHRVADAVGELPLERYGLTETGLDVANPYVGDRRPGSVGLPLPGVELRLDDGEILLRGPQVFAGYWRDEAATAAAFRPGGWFRTGDLGRLDDGYLTITGRLKDLVITGGFNVSPREVEAVLAEHEAVAEVAVAGVPSERWGEQVTAWVVPAPGARPRPEELVAFARARLVAYKAPKRVVLVDELPRNAMGKLVRSELARRRDG